MTKGCWIVTAEYGQLGRCMVCPASSNIEQAKTMLTRMINEPTENDLQLIKEGKNLELRFVPEKDCWWNDPVLVD